ncbi:hypothetical protein B4168_0689 [Anoxybacillus flavithermus]|nr:hypothetical protein B4168_0689 [Anoxybacillus flavithermus]OAO86699.1 hypothetical protein GT23_1717 [Parageobacillus thermoglucosidasius]
MAIAVCLSHPIELMRVCFKPVDSKEGAAHLPDSREKMESFARYPF